MSTQAEGTGSQDQRDADLQLRRLQTWTEKPFPIELREGSKTPFLHQFSSAQLREGLVYAVTANRALAAEYDSLMALKNKQYAGEEHVQTFKGLMDRIAQNLEIEYDEDVMVENVLHAQDHATAIRAWKGSGWYQEERQLRYTICVISGEDVRGNGAGVGHLERLVLARSGCCRCVRSQLSLGRVMNMLQDGNAIETSPWHSGGHSNLYTSCFFRRSLTFRLK